MGQIDEPIGIAEVEAKSLGHAPVWDTVGEQMASGRCTKCGATLSLAVSRDGLHESTGGMLDDRCGFNGSMMQRATGRGRSGRRRLVVGGSGT